jgi:hypothetical protein
MTGAGITLVPETDAAMTRGQVVLCSKHVALLTPVAESLLALLLPFSWQGAYIPVLPTCLLDVIDVRTCLV